MKIITFDTETTGTDTDNDRIITCFMRAKDGDKIVFEQNWVIDPGVEIPKEASDVHGMTTEWVREHGRKDVAEAVREIFVMLSSYASRGFVVAGYNHSFDLGMLDAELRRYFPDDEGLRMSKDDFLYLDPLILDRGLDRFRKGSRKLMDVAKHYGVEVDESKLHDALYDVEVTELLVPKVLNMAWKKTSLYRWGQTPEEFIWWLQEKQVEWRKEWADGLTKYFARSGKLEEDGSPIKVSGSFPW